MLHDRAGRDAHAADCAPVLAADGADDGSVNMARATLWARAWAALRAAGMFAEDDDDCKLACAHLDGLATAIRHDRG